jgi:hypothetical protein
MKQPSKSDDPRRVLQLKVKKKNDAPVTHMVKDHAPIQERREELEPEGEQARLKKAKGK